MKDPERTPGREVAPVLVTGGTGFVGLHLRAALRESPVVLLGRRTPELLSNERWLYTNLAEPVDPDQLASGKVLCHLAYSMAAGHENIDHNRRLLDVVNASPNIERVIMTSSVSVYGANNKSVVDEESPCNPVGEYATSKLACEMVWREGLREDCHLTVLRPSEVIGPRGKGLLSLIRDATERPVVGAIKRGALYHRRLHYVAVTNVTAAIRFCLEYPQQAAREVYVISDDHQPENRSYAAMQDAVRAILSKPPLPSLSLPRSALRVLGILSGRSALDMWQVFSSRKIHRAGFEDAVSVRKEVTRVIEDLRRAV